MFKSYDLAALRRRPDISYYFRYPLYHGEFRELREKGRLVGRFAAKPLYGRLTPEGRVDRSRGFDGRIAVIFIPARTKSAPSAQLLLTRIPKDQVLLRNRKRNWPRIREAAKTVIRRRLRSSLSESPRGSRPAPGTSS